MDQSELETVVDLDPPLADVHAENTIRPVIHEATLYRFAAREVLIVQLTSRGFIRSKAAEIVDRQIDQMADELRKQFIQGEQWRVTFNQ